MSSSPSSQTAPKEPEPEVVVAAPPAAAKTAIPEEGLPSVPDKYRDLIEKTLANVEAELADEASWTFHSEKNGVKAFTKVDGSLTAAKGTGYLPYHPRAIWELAIDSSKRKSVDPQLAAGKLLTRLDAQTTIDHLEYSPIFIVAGRDFCNLTHWRVMPDGSIVVIAQSIEELDLCPSKEPKVVRAQLHFALTKITPNADYTGADVTLIVKTDLRGSIPFRVASSAAAQQPFVIQRYGEQLKKSKNLAEVAALGKVKNTIL
jgi:hypothetical protein